MKKYDIIYADVPWNYQDKRRHDPDYAGITYPTMTTEELCELPVGKIANKNCALFMWVTGSMLPDCLKIMASWGFKFKTTAFVWEKLNPKSKTPVSLMGRYTMSSCEFVLVGTKGHPKRIRNNVRQLVQEVRTVHSAKPKEVHKRITDIYGDLPRIELFAREPVEGWTTIGNDINGKDIRDALREIIDE